ncbi:hypothetical protein IM792_11880 [Mucilaginibacter sp. JRF]|uniref:capsule assembly Wzi family protein n=1 Tax=Mucilaginibacter sp. JRF TaxID=2780088 RepID=UPI001880E2FC|nr:capsule assembly Wzi family protein [Mucilaginibacter sp. JRF]MBE9585150.1 hypothetical protein [Mucilaginibacter sp. JRF]
MQTKFLLLYIIILTSSSVYSQNIPTGNYIEDVLRWKQVSGKHEIKTSFAIRPILMPYNDTTINGLKGIEVNKLYNLLNIGAVSGLKILPFSLLTEYNFKRPYGYNNGTLYPNRGFQTRFSGGFLYSTRFLKIQINPEFVHAENKKFDTFTSIHATNNSQQFLASYFETINGIDAPERFGNKSISRIYPGQSKITLNYKNVEVGISTENLWWGPSIKNSIIMSNSAPGFLHWTVNSTGPIRTNVGSFEWQLIGGKLKQSDYEPYNINLLEYGTDLYNPKPRTDRYISAVTVNWQPKWLKGLYLGVSGSTYMDIDSVYKKKNVIQKTVPIFVGSSMKANDINNGSNGDGQDFAYAFSLRQLLPYYSAELYFEWARNDRSGNLNDFIQEPGHSSALTVGGRKLFELKKNIFLQLKSEITQLQRHPTYLLRESPIWYVHSVNPRDGYTNQGRYLGAGIGPGGNSFMIDASYLNGLNSYGFTFERYVHNNDLYYQAFRGTSVSNRHWVDLSYSFYSNVKIRRYLLSINVTPIYTLNYQYTNGSSFNLHARLNCAYYFN